MNKTKITICFGLLFLAAVLSMNGSIVPITIEDGKVDTVKPRIKNIEPKSSAGYIETFIHIDAIDPNNWSNTAAANPWCYEQGGVYYIENVSIDAFNNPTGSGILINNSREVDFVIKNCTIIKSATNGYNAGIRLDNCTNGLLIENNCTENWFGICLNTNCWNISIVNNTLSGNKANGVRLDGNVTECMITGNICSDTSGTGSGITLWQECSNNILSNNTCSQNSYYGIFIVFGSCENNTLYDNIANENGYRGISVSGSNHVVSNNTINSNGISTSTGYGMYLSSATNVTIFNNTILDNSLTGIYLSNSHNCTILENTIGNSELSSEQNIGIYLRYANSDYNTITDNIIRKNDDIGLQLQTGCDENKIEGNTIIENRLYGIWIFNVTTECHENVITGNSFNNSLAIANAKDNCTNNNWDGNWWHDYGGVDTNDDFVGDTPYDIMGSGNAQDNAPIWDDGADPIADNGDTGDSDDDESDDDYGDDGGNEAAIPMGNYYLIPLVFSIVAIIYFQRRKN